MGNTIWVPITIQYIFGIVGNIFALVLLILSRKQHKWISFYRLFTGLVISDLAIWLFAVSPAMVRYASEYTWTLPSALCEYELFMHMFGLLSSVFIVCAMTVDRLKAMCSKRNEHRNKLYIGILVFIWTFTGLYSSLHLVTNRTRLYYPGTYCYVDNFNVTNDITGKIFLLRAGVFCFTVNCGTERVDANCLACRNLELRSRLTDRHRISGGYDWHCYLFLAIVAVVFTSLWTPHFVSPFGSLKRHIFMTGAASQTPTIL